MQSNPRRKTNHSPTAARPLPEPHAPPCAQPSPPCTVCCSPHTPRAPCTITPPKSSGHTSHSARVQTRAPECRTPNISAGHTLRMPAHGLPPNLRLHRAYPRAAAPAKSPNNAAPLDTPRSALAAGVDTPHPAALGNCQLRVSQACQWPHSQSRPKLKLQKLRAVVNYNAMAATRIKSLQTPNKSGL